MKLKRVINHLRVSENSIVDRGDGLIEFKEGLVITDGSEQRNGTKYDIKSMDLSEFSGVLTVNHDSEIQSIVAKVGGLAKKAGKVVIKSLRFAVEESALAVFTYNMLKAGFVKDFSIETIGPWPNEDDVYKDSKLLGLSAVVIGNNKSARVKSDFQEIITNSLNESEDLGLDTSSLKNLYSSNISSVEDKMYKTIKNAKSHDVVVKYVNAAGDEVDVTLAPGATVDVPEDQADGVQAQVDDAVAPEAAGETTDTEEETTDADETTEDETPADNSVIFGQLKKLDAQMQSLKKALVGNSEEPQFRSANTMKKTKELGGTSWKERTANQILNGWDFLKSHDSSAQKRLYEINAFHLDQLKEKGVVENSVTISDMGNFVIAPEMFAEIQGQRSDFSALLGILDYRETLSLQMAWLKRSGDINMQEVEMCDDDADGNMKPVSEYGATPEQANLHELAAVTPVCNAATRFLAVDLLGDIAQGYRTDYDRKRAQLAVARLQQAIDATGQEIDYDPSTDLASLKSWIDVWGEAQEEIMNGVFIFNQKTYAKLLSAAVGAGISGPLATLFTTGDQASLLGSRYIVVPNELMPTLGTNEVKTFVIEGANVTIHDSVIYFNPSTFTGRTSGGLQYDLSSEAAYEVEGEVRSAYQRNELVIRGSFFRNGAVKDENQVVGLGTEGLS